MSFWRQPRFLTLCTYVSIPYTYSNNLRHSVLHLSSRQAFRQDGDMARSRAMAVECCHRGRCRGRAACHDTIST